MADVLPTQHQQSLTGRGLKRCLFGWFFLLFTPSLVLGQSYSLRLNSDGFYEVYQNTAQVSPAARKAQNATLSIADDARRPANAVMLTVSFASDLNLDNISSFSLLIKTSPEFRAFAEVIFLSGKAINKATRTMQIPVGGLNENTDYYFTLYHFSGCDGDETGQVHYKTGTAPQKPRKVLLVLDQHYETDAQIQQALTIYKTDATRADPRLVFEQTYLSANPAEKGLLYEKIKAKYYDAEAPLHYLFFIGRMPSALTRSDLLDHRTNQPLPGFQHGYASLGVYTKILTQDFPFDSQENLFINRRYDCQRFGKETIPNDIMPVVLQSSISDISFGAVIPTRPEEGKDYILRYFEKLHRFKTGKINFDKKVLLADTFYNDGTYPKQIEQLSGRWMNNDTITVPQKYGPNFHGFDPVWQTDYLRKVGTNSYEIVYYYGHGEPTRHYYGITPTEINQLEKLNTLLFDFTSCSVGNVDFPDYLAGVYLNKGNTLFINSYSTPIASVVYDDQSPLLERFKEKQLFHTLANGAYASDAYRHGYTFNNVQFLLGDPLLLLDPPICDDTEPLVITTTGSLSLCAGDTTTLNLPANFTDFRWFRNEQEISGAKANSLVVTQGGFYTAKAKRCGQDVSSNKGIAITDKPRPETPVLTLETFPDRFRLRVTPAGAFSSFNWFINGERWQETTQDTARPILLAEYTVKVFKESCSAESKPVSVRIAPPVLSPTGPAFPCDGDSVVLKAPDNFSSYIWLVKDGAPVVTTSPTRVFKQSASVAVRPKRGNLEGPTSDYVTFVIHPKPPKPSVTLEQDGFRSSSPANNQWYRNGNPLPDSTRQLLRNPGAGTYYVRVTEQGCYSNSDPMMITAVAPVAESLKVYPNPGKGVFWVEWPASFRSGQLEILDNLGRRIEHYTYTTPPSGPAPIHLKAAPGLYLLRFSNAGQNQTVKLLFEGN